MRPVSSTSRRSARPASATSKGSQQRSKNPYVSEHLTQLIEAAQSEVYGSSQSKANINSKNNTKAGFNDYFEEQEEIEKAELQQQEEKLFNMEEPIDHQIS